MAYYAPPASVLNTAPASQPVLSDSRGSGCSLQSSVKRWLAAQPIVPAAPPPSRAESVVIPSGCSELPLGAEAANVVRRSARASQHSRSTRRSGQSIAVPIELITLTSKLTDSLVQVAAQSRLDATHRERDALKREELLLQAKTETEKQAADVSLQKDKLMAEKERQAAEISLQREKMNAELTFKLEQLLMESYEKEKQRYLILQKERISADARKEQMRIQEEKRKEEQIITEKCAEKERILADYKKQMALAQQLADEQKKVALLQKQNEIDKRLFESRIAASIRDSRTQGHADLLRSHFACADRPTVDMSSSVLHELSPEAEGCGLDSESDHSSPPTASQMRKSLSATVAPATWVAPGLSQIPEDTVVTGLGCASGLDSPPLYTQAYRPLRPTTAPVNYR